MQLRDWIFGLFGAQAQTAEGQPRHRGQATHVIILDGTASSLKDGCETHAGMTYKLLNEVGHQANLTVHYEAGIQWRDWRGTWDVMTGKGINKQIERAYGVLASRYRLGDKIVLIGYSRGAYAVRSLAGVIEIVGLVKNDFATVRTIRTAYRHYRTGGRSKFAERFRAEHCHPRTETSIEAVAVWDTVKALGIRVPIIWRWMNPAQPFHNHTLGPQVRNGFHALALDETREAYAPVLWTSPTGWTGNMEQVWFRGAHSDIGGQIGIFPPARPLANIPLVWMLKRLEMCGVPLPTDWGARFETDVNAPSFGSWRGWGKVFWGRRRRLVGMDPSERLHVTVDPARYRKVFVRDFQQTQPERASPQSS
ncbi:DUF2235 domain-containing protein [Loktanella sp. F6476L]|uniref:DUF2235 domain-containing protein n=1 Tax=Loktanella sp. F6476L TaxID=2926405 RepID=UPI001FF18CC5|nr:DUF2235 domain-containing protein [Loktanella sp. F6476L]